MVKEEDDVLDIIVQDVFVNLWKAGDDRIVGSHENVFVPIHATSLSELYAGEEETGRAYCS